MKQFALWLTVSVQVLLIPSFVFPLTNGVQWPFPLAETESVLRRWLGTGGFEVERSSDDSGRVSLRARRGSERWDLVLQPSSPLATAVRAETGSEERDRGAEGGLAQLLKDYSAHAPLGHPLPEMQVPKLILAEKDFVFCIEASKGGQKFRFSGFAVDGEGRVVTTAHDLEGVRTVTLTSRSGATFEGRLVRLDLLKDLALIQTVALPRGFVPLGTARLVLKDGESVFSIGCPSGSSETFREGRVRTPMRKMDALYLWEVEMETLPGASGGPVFDADGLAVGVVKGRLRGTETTGFLIPAETVLRFLAGK